MLAWIYPKSTSASLMAPSVSAQTAVLLGNRWGSNFLFDRVKKLSLEYTKFFFIFRFASSFSTDLTKKKSAEGPYLKSYGLLKFTPHTREALKLRRAATTQTHRYRPVLDFSVLYAPRCFCSHHVLCILFVFLCFLALLFSHFRVFSRHFVILLFQRPFSAVVCARLR